MEDKMGKTTYQRLAIAVGQQVIQEYVYKDGA